MSKELIERLRGNPFAVRGADYLEAADAIESLTAERDRLAEAVKLRDDLADTVSKALSRAWSLGQAYWSQADSESHSQNRKTTETQAKFNALVDATRDAILSAPVQAAVPSTTEETIRTATQYAHNLVVSLHRDHYQDNNSFEPFDDLLGLLSQIDNMICGWKEPAAVPDDVAMSCFTCKHADDDDESYPCRNCTMMSHWSSAAMLAAQEGKP